MPMAAAALAAEGPRARESGVTVSVTFNVLETFASASTSNVLSMQQDLRVAQTFVGDALRGNPFSFGVSFDDGQGRCSSGVAMQSAEAHAARYPLVWSADAKVLEASTDHLLLSVSWRRLEPGSDGKPTESASEEIESVSLREKDRVLLDFVRSPESRCIRNAALEITASIKEDAALASSQLTYDLWLVHEARDGKHASGRAQLTAGQGELTSFAFPRQKLPALASGAGADQRLQVAVTGQLRGRVRRDGMLELALDTQRGLSYVTPDGSNDGGIMEGGLKTVAVRPGEAVRVDLPNPTAGSATASDPRAARMAQDLEGHSFAVIVKAKPLS
jgi:hypothetical protein